MPWRAASGQTPDPYKVWLSEIMLQQTTVATVGPYFVKFVERWPTVDALADAPLDDVLRMWAGLGYYRRARMLHACARTLQSDFGGQLPPDEKTLLSLPGFGPYTAAAVAAIAFDRPANVVDGNVERVMARIFNIAEPLPKGKKALRAAAESLVPQKRCGDYAQALMDLGATICTPRAPKCDVCPWSHACKARAAGVQDKRPRRAKAKPRPVRRAMAFLLFDRKGQILLRRRAAHGLLGGMLEVPGTPWDEGAAPAWTQALAYAPVRAEWRQVPGAVTHVFSHFTLEIGVAVAVSSRRVSGIWVPLKSVADEALPSVMKKIVAHALKAVPQGL